MPKEYTLIGGNGTRVSPLEVNESGTYEAGDSRAFNPVKVNVPSGSSTLSGLTDVDISNPSNGQTLVYNATSEKWENGAGGGGVLYVSAVGDSLENCILDTQWSVIDAAIRNGTPCYLKFIEETEEHSDAFLAPILLSSAEDGDYAVAINTGFQATAFVTSSQDGYPAIGGDEGDNA